MKLHQLMQLMPSRDRGYITVQTEAGSAVCFDCGPGFIANQFKDRDVLYLEPIITVGEKDRTAYAGLLVIVKE